LSELRFDNPVCVSNSHTSIRYVDSDDTYKFAFVKYNTDSKKYYVKEITHPMNKVFDLNDQTS